MSEATTGKYIEQLPGGLLTITNELKVILEGTQTGYNSIQALATFFNKHSHANKAILDKFTLDGEQLLYDGQPVGGVSYKGYFPNSTSLQAAFPVGQDGWYATVGSTDTIWLWDADSTAWVDSGNGFSGTAAEIHAAASKANPADNDELGLVDSEDSYSLKKITWSNIKAALKSFFDTVYQAAGSYLTSVVVDGTTITGNGTAGSPLVANVATPDVTRHRANPTVSSNVLTLDFNNKNELIAKKSTGGGIDVAADFSFAFSNIINAEFAQVFLNLSASATITLPASTITASPLNLEAGKYQAVFTHDGSDWYFVISEPEVVPS